MNNDSSPSQPFVTFLSWAALLLALTCLSLLAWYIPLNRTNFVPIFKDFNLDLPAAARFVLSIPAIAFPIVAGVIGLAAFAMQCSNLSRTGLALFHMFIVVLCCVTFVVYREAMSQPMFTLIDGISGKK